MISLWRLIERWLASFSHTRYIKQRYGCIPDICPQCGRASTHIGDGVHGRFKQGHGHRWHEDGYFEVITRSTLRR